MKKKVKVCHKWEHDFSYDGKKKHKDIVCRDCGKNMVEWVNERQEEFNKKFEGKYGGF